MFVCKYNAFRSKAAEGYFKSLNKNKKIEVSSAGFFQGSVADKMQKSFVKKILGVEIKGKSKELSLELLRKQDLVVVVAKDIPKVMFNHKKGYGKAKFVYWNIKDEHMQKKRNVESSVKGIKKRVEMLIKTLK